MFIQIHNLTSRLDENLELEGSGLRLLMGVSNPQEASIDPKEIFNHHDQR